MDLSRLGKQVSTTSNWLPSQKIHCYEKTQIAAYRSHSLVSFETAMYPGMAWRAWIPLVLAYPALFVIRAADVEEMGGLDSALRVECPVVELGCGAMWVTSWLNLLPYIQECFSFCAMWVAPFKPDHCARRIVAMVLSSYSKLLLKHEAFSKQAWPSNNKLSFSFCSSSSQPHTATKSSSRSENSAALTFGYSGW